MPIPKNIKIEHIIKAIKKIDVEGVPPKENQENMTFSSRVKVILPNM
jgi:hypothetical protein